MTEYIKTFGNFILTLDIGILLLVGWCVLYNGYKVYQSLWHGKPSDYIFRVLLLIMCIFFGGANIVAFTIHLDNYIYHPLHELSKLDVERSLEDRTGMAAAAVMKMLFTIKYKPNWYKD